MTKRALYSVDVPVFADKEAKRRNVKEWTGFVNLDEDLLFEVLKHADARTLATAACVSKQWRRTAEDELLWEMNCTRHWANIGCDSQQLRSVVLALGGFRRLHALCLWPLLKTPSSSTTSSSPHSSPHSPVVVSSKRTKPRWGRDEVNLSLSLFSIQYYENLNFNNRGCDRG
ncbi:hypothetical protein F0562_006638 [Nyssa sinensis]|uniref:F-box protein GID2 n=1 Tax=Nyssa sinensis TaxID=561372 RepID=A0A5J5AKP8_9ASTE|nr:hypothetical protein F0562_006638 [Nyssa sinensis]